MYAWRKCTLFCVKKVCGMFAGLRKISTFASAIAEIAQLVEHNLAKVRVASSSLVFRSSLYILLKMNRRCFVMNDAPSFFYFLLRAFMGLGLSPCLFLFQGKSQHHTIVAVCQRSDCFKGAIVAFAGNQGNQL